MITRVLRLTRWEFFKVRRRWMLWILLGIVVVITQFAIWGSYAAYHSEAIRSLISSGSFSSTTRTDDGIVSIHLTCADVEEGRVAEKLEALPEDVQERMRENVQEFVESCGGTTLREDLRQIFSMPNSITIGLVAAQSVLPILIMVLAASLYGGEHGWGTLRNALTMGVGRWQFLTSKLLLLVVLGATGLMAVSVLIAISSLAAAIFPPSEVGGVFGSGTWSEAALRFGKVVYAMAPYIALATFLAVLTQSSAMGISISLGYYVIELIVSPILQLFSWLENVPDYLIGNNVNIWLSEAAAVSTEVTRDGVALAQPGTLHAFLVLLAYILVLGAVAFWLFLRRDIAGAKGE